MICSIWKRFWDDFATKHKFRGPAFDLVDLCDDYQISTCHGRCRHTFLSRENLAGFMLLAELGDAFI